MGTKDPRVDTYIEKAQPFARPILRQIRSAVHAGCPDVEETLKWSAPFFDYRGALCGMAAFKQHCALIFWKAQLLDLPGSRADSAMGQFGSIRSVEDLPPKEKLVDLVRRAAQLNDDGVKAPRTRKAPKAAIEMPAVFAAALKKNKKALAIFEKFSPSHKREYLEWITEAKQDATRERRVATAIGWIAKGKSRNWKYQR